MLFIVFAMLGLGALGCGNPDIVVPRLMAVTAMLPSHGTTQVSPAVEGLIYFSDPVASPAEAAQAIDVTCAGTPPCASPDPAACVAVDPTVSFDATDQVARIFVAPQFGANLCYTLKAGKGIEPRTADVGPLPLDVTATFITAP